MNTLGAPCELRSPKWAKAPFPGVRKALTGRIATPEYAVVRLPRWIDLWVLQTRAFFFGGLAAVLVPAAVLATATNKPVTKNVFADMRLIVTPFSRLCRPPCP